jgi:hypothetical protein
MGIRSQRQPSRTKLARAFMAALAGGTLCGDCQTRFKDAFVQGTRDFVLQTLLDPANFVDLVLSEDEASSESP